MKVCLLGPSAYARRVDFAGWPVPPELCDRETAAASYRLQLDLYQLADEVGFDWVSLSEHHYAPGLMTPNPLVMAGAVSQRTTRVKIAVLGPLLPLANPVRVAEELAMLDCISGGRTVALFLRGTPNEHLTYSADGAASPYTREITQEGVRLILKAWREPKPFSWRGERFSFEHVSVWPRSFQEPHIPVFFSGNSPESAEFAAANPLGLAISFASLDVVAERVAFYRRCAESTGWTPGVEDVLYRGFALVANDDEHARHVAEGLAHSSGERGGSPAGFLGLQFVGSPTTIAAEARRYRDAGVGTLDLAIRGDAFGRGGARQAIEAFAQALPSIHAL